MAFKFHFLFFILTNIVMNLVYAEGPQYGSLCRTMYETCLTSPAPVGNGCICLRNQRGDFNRGRITTETPLGLSVDRYNSPVCMVIHGICMADSTCLCPGHGVDLRINQSDRSLVPKADDPADSPSAGPRRASAVEQ